jgi:hypothetical protein
VLLLSSNSAFAWGPQGHRISAHLAEPYLSESAKAGIYGILGDEDLGRASTWADIMRSHPSMFWQERAGAYHYVTVPPGHLYSSADAPAKGDAVIALAAYRRVLLDPDSPRREKQLALRFSIHIIQDLHQPMHVGNGKDRGGNQVKLRFQGKSTNLHQLWDSRLLKSADRPEAAWVRYLGRQMQESQVKAWSQPEPAIWIEESATLRDTIYPTGAVIGQPYADKHMPTLELRLRQAAIRTAAYLNALFSELEST